MVIHALVKVSFVLLRRFFELHSDFVLWVVAVRDYTPRTVPHREQLF